VNVCERLNKLGVLVRRASLRQLRTHRPQSCNSVNYGEARVFGLPHMQRGVDRSPALKRTPAFRARGRQEDLLVVPTADGSPLYPTFQLGVIGIPRPELADALALLASAPRQCGCILPGSVVTA
jgi:hypothetical protein